MLKPKKVTDADLAFGGAVNELLPAYADIPQEFKQGSNKWNTVVSDWFYYGLKGVVWEPNEGIDVKDALRHVKAVLGSYAPKHEHKMAGCAYLLSEFFADVTYVKGK